MRIQKTDKCQGSEVQEATLVSKVPTTETTRKNQPTLPVPNSRVLKNRQEVHKTNKQQQTMETNNKKQSTTTTTSDDKTTTKTTASRVATIADLFKSKQQEHEMKQSQQTTKKTLKKTTTTTNNMEVKKQETPKARKTIQKPTTTTRKPNNNKLQQTLRQMWDKSNLNKSEQQQDQSKTTTNDNQTTTKEKTTKMDNNKQQKPAIKDLEKKQAASKNKISDIEDLKLFLARKKLERAKNGASKHTAVSSSTQPQNFLPSSARSSDSGGDRTSQTKPGMKNIAAKGKEFSAGTYDWVESTTRPGSTQ